MVLCLPLPLLLPLLQQPVYVLQLPIHRLWLASMCSTVVGCLQPHVLLLVALCLRLPVLTLRYSEGGQQLQQVGGVV